MAKKRTHITFCLKQMLSSVPRLSARGIKPVSAKFIANIWLWLNFGKEKKELSNIKM
jgi:hypothetical protein